MALTVRVHSAMAEIPEPDWQNLTSALPTPILEWCWLDWLERSGSIDIAHGWAPQHLTLWDAGRLVAGAPLYLRDHSWGDFVYDFAFAQAAQSRGMPWYPKLVGMSPATPSVGWQVLVAPGEDSEGLTERWLAEAEKLARKLGAVSLQANFTDPAWSDALPGRWERWSHQHFLWTNDGFSTFDDYLGAFDKNQRRNIKRERASMEAQGLTLKLVSGDEIPQAWFGLMGELYDRTNSQFGPYAARFLEPEFFLGLEAIRPILTLAATFEAGDPTPLALGFLLKKGPALVGRYWGERRHVDDLYFNICYYRPIEWAIEHGIQSFDPGAGSELKVRRGFRSFRNVSLHRFFDASAGRLFAANVDRFNRQEEATIEALNEAVPFKQTQVRH
ncbi:MAG: peptidogalycan biosysnthesis protein [Spirochaetales bacterium]